MTCRAYTARLALASLLGALALLAVGGPAQALADGAHWELVARSAPTHLQPGKKGAIRGVIVNLGDAAASGTNTDPIVIRDTLPAGVEQDGPMFGAAGVGVEGLKNPSLKCEELHCRWEGPVPPFISLSVTIPVKATEEGQLGENEMRVEGGGVPTQLSRRMLTASAAEPAFGVESYGLKAEEADGSPDLQAGTHPFQLTTTLELNQRWYNDPFAGGEEVAGTPQLLKNIFTTLPAGLVADTVGVPQCSDAAFAANRTGSSNECPSDSAIGVANVTFTEPVYEPMRTEAVPLFNLAPEAGEPARLGFMFDEVPVVLDTAIKTGDGYAAEVRSLNNPQAAELLGAIVTVWGEPNAPSHDSARGWACIGNGHFIQQFFPEPCPKTTAAPSAAYLTLPTQCEKPLATSVRAESWVPGEASSTLESSMPQLQGCSQLPFEPSIRVAPARTQTSTPSGLGVEITLPQAATLTGEHAEADIKETTMELPEGLQVNPGSADGLETCGTGEAGFERLSEGGLATPALASDSGSTLEGELEAQRFTSEGVSCPGASNIGEVSIDSPLLEHELTGFVYLGQQDTNPFASPLVLYLIAEDPVSGVRVKLAGEVRVQADGRIVSVFKNTPPLPFSRLRVNLYDGPRASQSTPAFCRASETTASFVTWSGQAPAPSSSSFTPTSTPNGTPCQSQGPLPFTPTQQAGAVNNDAGAFSPFTLTIERPDGDQALKSITTQLPPGEAALLASVTPCPEPQAAEGTCGPESLIGTSTASSGLGSDPYPLPGKVYLTGPYDNAPFGLSSVTEAKAGVVGAEKAGTSVGAPVFDLGRVVVRSSINVNPYTAAASIDTDAAQFFPLSASDAEPTTFAGLPELIKGVPAQIKQLNVTIDRPGFEFNPTNCSRMEVTGTLTGYEGGSTPVSSPFQMSNCASLPFTPKLTATVKGQGSKANGVSFDVTVQSPGLGQANIHKVDLTLPKALPSRLETIQKACRVQVFEVNPAACDEGSVIGEGIVHTPVFKNPLRGPAYLVGHAGAEFPDVEFVLQGEGVTIVLDGKTFIKNGVTTSKFETSPDAPFTKFESLLPEGPHSALGIESLLTGPARNLCKLGSLAMPTEIEGQNGAMIKQTTKIALTGCGAVKGSTTKKLSRAQMLAKALKACRKKKRGASLAACERAARKRYGAAKSAKKSSRRR